MTKKNIILIFSIIWLSMSCDEFVPYEVFIDNQTYDTIYIAFNKVDHTYTCLPNSTIPIYQTEGRIQSHYDCDPRLSYWEAEVKLNNGKKCKKDILNKDNFICEGKRRQGWKLTFIVTEDDIE